MVPDRMACRRTRANEILSVHAARKHQPPRLGERHQAAVADRARLPGPQTGARAWPLRGARVAWLSSSRHAVHRRIRIPDLRKGSDSPLRTKRRHSRRRTSPSRRLSTPRIPPSDLNVTWQPRSPLSAWSSPAQSHASSRDARVASASHRDRTCDTVRLAGCGKWAIWRVSNGSLRPLIWALSADFADFGCGGGRNS